MATARRELDAALNRPALQHLLEMQPYCVRFFQAVRLLGQICPEREPVGQFANPDQELVRFTAHPSTSFPASEIQSVDFTGDAPPRMEVNFMGLTGPEGTLPIPYTELVMERLRARDTVLRDFLDLFNHRIISLFYSAWERSHFVIEPKEAGDRLSQCLLALLGLATTGLQARQEVPDSSLLHYAGLLIPHVRSALGLQDLLSDYFDVPVEILQFAGAWYRLSPDDQTHFADDGSLTDSLGLGTVLGDEVWDQQSRVSIRIGPLDLDRYLDFLPTGHAYQELRALLRFYFNEQLDFELQLVLKRGATPCCQLGESGATTSRLGWVSWMGSTACDVDRDETTLPL